METFYYLEKALRSLSPVEQKHFEKFLSSSYFHKRHFHNSQLLKFYRNLNAGINRIPRKNQLRTKEQHSFNFTKDLLSDESEIIKKIFADRKPDSRNQLFKLKSELISCFLDFLSIESFTGNSVFYKLSILNELNRRNLEDIFWHFCREDRFDELNSAFEEPQKSFYIWKLVQALNKHKEKKTCSVSYSHSFDESKIDYETEKQLLIKYTEKELADIRSRQQSDNLKITFSGF